MVAASPSFGVEEDQHVVLRVMSWQDYEVLLAIRGERSGVRMYYLDGEIEIVSATKIHEGRKKTLARLLELWAMESGVALNGFGSWTLKAEFREAGAEPDECYIVGDPDKAVPDLAIEVEWSRATGLSKQEIYLRLGFASCGRSRATVAWSPAVRADLDPAARLVRARCDRGTRQGDGSAAPRVARGHAGVADGALHAR